MPLANGDVTPTQSIPPTPLPKVINIKPLSTKKSFFDHWGNNDPHLIALYAFLLGILFSASLACAFIVPTTPQCWLYINFLCLFHFMEYYITAKYKPESVTLDAYLFNNGVRYLMAQILGVVEFVVEWYFFPHTKILSQTTLAGFCIAVLGQTFRSLAMIHAATNFNHQIQRQKDPTHVLVTNGVYSLVRHPSYFGFFWWAVGIQIFLANPLSTIIFVCVLWKFFSDRIKIEEEYLVEFFGDEYIDYRKKVGTWIPFIQ